ncbi:MAG: LON peptidase substrate-binding domain-containing protein [Deltaproteobacteria bacterium]|nr:LON peptidase substrate-binding domain-containing protein [Deltaproteobacteria bacterium]
MAEGPVVEIPIFPLPNVVFFPHTHLPLHIFEPRYRQMIGDCLAGDRRLAVVLLKPGWDKDYYGAPPVYQVAGAGEIVNDERLPDGRYNILLRGFARVAIEEELPSDKLYRIVRARQLPDRYGTTARETLREALGTLRSAFLRLLTEIQRSEDQLLNIVSAAGDPGAMLDRIASIVVPEAESRQKILEALDVEDRLRLVTSSVLETLLRLSSQKDGGAERSRLN